MSDKKTKWGQIVLMVIITLFAGLGIYKTFIEKAPELAPIQQVGQRPVFTDENGVNWAVTDTLFASIDGFRFIKSFVLQNMAGDQRYLNTNTQVVMLIALASSDDLGIQNALTQFQVALQDADGKQYFPK